MTSITSPASFSPDRNMKFATLVATLVVCGVALANDYGKGYDAPMPFAFGYAVKDEYSYNDYSHDTKSDGKTRTGSYRTLLPDGRTQIVNYVADEYGYRAEVTYEGYAKYPEYKKPSSYP